MQFVGHYFSAILCGCFDVPECLYYSALCDSVSICSIVMLQDISVECVAILNDTVGCLMSCAFRDHNTQVGVILGMVLFQ